VPEVELVEREHVAGIVGFASTTSSVGAPLEKSGTRGQGGSESRTRTLIASLNEFRLTPPLLGSYAPERRLEIVGQIYGGLLHAIRYTIRLI
jgi:hypothetical protein